MKAVYFTVELPELGSSVIWIGGELKPSSRTGHVWLTLPNGAPVLEVKREHVRQSSEDELTQRIVAERDAGKVTMN
jgi:hypothetical protein